MGKDQGKEAFAMAENITRISIDDVRASVQRIRDRGEKLVDRLRSDAKDLIANAPKVASLDEARKRLDEARKRAEDAVKAVQDLRSRRDEIVTNFVTRTINALGLAKAEHVTRLEARVAELERRVEAASKTDAAA
jgi:polyhydroxyalkanoate synthesis regulator phasin